jgi:O-antigen ligase
VATAALVTAVWGVLAMAGVYPWGWWPLLWGAAVTGTLGLVAARRHVRTRDNSVAFAVGLLALAVALQLLPLTPAIVAVLSPATLRFQHTYLQVSSEVVSRPGVARSAATGAVLRPASAPAPLSLRPGKTLEALAFVMAYGLLVAGGAAGLTVTGARRLAAGLLALGVAVALVAIVQRATPAPGIYDIWRPRFAVDGFGPFVNRNHFAGWMTMAVSVGLGFLTGRANRAMHGIEGWRNRVLWLSSPEAAVVLLSGGALFVMGMSAVLTASRSGTGALLVALLVVGSRLARQRSGSRPRRLAAASYLTLFALGIMLLAGLPALSARFANTAPDEPFALAGREDLWRDAANVASQFPATGTGLGTYTSVTPFFQAIGPGRSPNTDQAHSDYLQLAAEGGLLVGIPALALVVVFIRKVRHRFRTAGSSLSSYWLRVGAVAGLLATALQEAWEFSLQTPANSVLFAILCAIALHGPDEAPVESDVAPTPPASLGPWRARPVRALAALLLIGAPAPLCAQVTDEPIEPARVQLGPLGLTPSIAQISLGFDTNLFNEFTFPKSDLSFTVSPQLETWLRAGRSRLQVGARSDLVYFRRYASESSIDGMLTARFEMRAARLTPWLSGSVTSGRQRWGTEIDLRFRRRTQEIGAGVNARVAGRTWMGLFVRQGAFSHQPDAAFLGSSLREALDRRTDAIGLQLQYAWTPLTTVVVSGERSHERFDYTPERNADSWRVDGGFDLSRFALIAGRGRVGYRRFVGIGGVLPAFTGVVASVEASSTRLRRMRVEISGQRDVNYSWDLLYPYFVLTGTAVTLTPQLTPRWDVQGRVGLMRLAYRAAVGVEGLHQDRVDRFELLGAGIGYRLGRDMRIGFDVDRERRTSPVQWRTFQGYRTGVSVTYGR